MHFSQGESNTIFLAGEVLRNAGRKRNGYGFIMDAGFMSTCHVFCQPVSICRSAQLLAASILYKYVDPFEFIKSDYCK